MRKHIFLIGAFAILFLFFLQMAGTLVESMYILDLMNTSLDEKALGTLFFFTPVLLWLLPKKAVRWPVWGLFGVLFFARGITPYLNTSDRLLASGLAVGSILLLMGLLLAARPKGALEVHGGWEVSGGLALAVGLSVLLRSLNFSLDLSLTFAGAWIGWGLGLLLGWLLTRLDWQPQPRSHNPGARVTVPLLGVFLILTLVYFAFSAPAVIARWTGISYPLMVIVISLLAGGWAWLAIRPVRWMARISRGALLAWNLAFLLSLAGTFWAQRVHFPQAPGDLTVVSGAVGAGQIVPVVLLSLLFPVLFADMAICVKAIRLQAPSPVQLAPGLLLGSAALVVLVFVNIFTNVWGYIDPISTPFRGLFWLPFLLSAGVITLLVALRPSPEAELARGEDGGASWGWVALMAVILLGSALGAFRTAPEAVVAANPSSLRVMTYNMQAGNDDSAELAYQRQLALIRRVSPDLVALQESDTARISLNNNDYVRYFADNLGYYSYYGPTPLAGSFGTAILSRYPLLNPQVLFSYSDSDEIGTTRVEIELGGRRFTVYNVHPDGSGTAKLAWAQTLLADAEGKPNVIMLGDFNTRKTDPAYRLFDEVYRNAWTSVYPSEISADGIDMSGRNRIDHIFLSPPLKARSPQYILPPESATDHPVHWTDIVWD